VGPSHEKLEKMQETNMLCWIQTFYCSVQCADSVENCWSVSGALRYKLKDDPTIYKVKSVFATVEQILASNVKK
jgi:hypothetical protein